MCAACRTCSSCCAIYTVLVTALALEASFWPQEALQSEHVTPWGKGVCYRLFSWSDAVAPCNVVLKETPANLLCELLKGNQVSSGCPQTAGDVTPCRWHAQRTWSKSPISHGHEGEENPVFSHSEIILSCYALMHMSQMEQKPVWYAY